MTESPAEDHPMFKSKRQYVLQFGIITALSMAPAVLSVWYFAGSLDVSVMGVVAFTMFVSALAYAGWVYREDLVRIDEKYSWK